MKVEINCVIVSAEDIVNYRIPRSEIKHESIYATNIKHQANGYPDTQVDIIRGQWYIPAETKYGMWLLLKYPNLKTGNVLVGME